MSPLLIVAATGLLVLLALAGVVGTIEGRAQRSAWTRIADQRRSLAARERALAEERAELLAWEAALVEDSERRRTM